MRRAYRDMSCRRKIRRVLSRKVIFHGNERRDMLEKLMGACVERVLSLLDGIWIRTDNILICTPAEAGRWELVLV